MTGRPSDPPTQTLRSLFFICLFDYISKVVLANPAEAFLEKGQSVRLLYLSDELIEQINYVENDNPNSVGELYKTCEKSEVMPFKFDHIIYYLIFRDPYLEAGDFDEFMSLSKQFANGYKPKVNSRIIKFYRSDAEDNYFQPNAWSLNRPSQIYEFSHILLLCIESYLTLRPEIEQFFFWPTTPQLTILYKRLFRNLKNGCFKNQVHSIIEHIGEFYGYERKETV